MPEKNDILCNNCRKKIAEGEISDGCLKIKCKCGTINTVEAHPDIVADRYQPKELSLGMFNMEKIST